MTGKTHLFLRTGIAAIVVALACWFWLPHTTLEKRAFAAMVGLEPQPRPEAITGNGTKGSPWRIQAPLTGDQLGHAPTVVTLNDDPEAIFQSYPHAPIDLAVIFSNMHRLGARKLACSPLLAWEAPDPIGLTALEEQINAFDTLIIAAPLTRGPVMQALPDPFRRASLPLEDIRGTTASLPVVNRVSLPNMIYGGDNTIAGFQVIDSEPAGDTTPLLARWDYRVVLAFPLLAAMQQLDVPVTQLRIHMGKSIQLGADGPRIPIDNFGRTTTPLTPPKLPPFIPAEKLIDANPSRVAKSNFSSPLLCDRRGNMDPASLEFNRHLPATIQSMTRDTVPIVTHTYTRSIPSGEIYTLFTIATLLAALATLPTWIRMLSFIAVIFACITIQSLVLQHFQLWLPGLPGCAATLAAALASLGGAPRTGTLLQATDGIDYVRYNGT